MSIFTAELIGTALLILLGNGVVSSCVLKQTHAVGVGVGWIVITTAWGFAVFVGVTVAGPVSGAHLNPAVTLGLAALGKTPWDQVPTYVAAQFLGAMLGAFCVWLYFRDQFAATEDEGAKKACFCTGPAIRNLPNNFFCETLATFVLLFVIYYIIGNGSITLPGQTEATPIGLGTLGALPVAILVWVIGLSLGSTTGYAIHPARDLGPRITHALLPIPGKGDSDWAYSWVPVVGPIIGAVAAGLIVPHIAGLF